MNFGASISLDCYAGTRRTCRKRPDVPDFRWWRAKSSFQHRSAGVEYGMAKSILTDELWDVVEPLTDGVVLLRSPRDTDVDAVVKHSQHPDLQTEYWLPVPIPCSPQEAKARIREFKAGFNGQFGLTLIISTPVNDRAFLGIITLGPRSAPNSTEIGEICYGVAPDYRNQGLATRALLLMTAYACSKRDNRILKRIELYIAIPNLASQRVADKAGFVREGIVRTRVPATGKEYDDVVYAYSCSHGQTTFETTKADVNCGV